MHWPRERNTHLQRKKERDRRYLQSEEGADQSGKIDTKDALQAQTPCR
eukprot:COSAG01_NODE_3602_length_5887_cov_20.077229_3_plen_48_part_00